MKNKDKKISDAHKGQRNKWLHKGCICVETGKEYESLSDAARDIKSYTTRISYVCQNPESTTKGFHFRYK